MIVSFNTQFTFSLLFMMLFSSPALVVKYFSGKFIHCSFPSPSKRTQTFRRCAIFFFFFFLHVLNFSCQPLISFCQFLPRWQNKSGNTLHFLLRASRARRLPSAPALAHAGSLVNSDRFCWVCDCCSVPVVQAWSGLRSASWLLFKWYFLNVSLFVYKHYFLTYATS